MRMRILAAFLLSLFVAVLPASACLNDRVSPSRESQFKSQYNLDGEQYAPPASESPLLVTLKGIGFSGAGLGLAIGGVWLGSFRLRKNNKA